MPAQTGVALMKGSALVTCLALLFVISTGAISASNSRKNQTNSKKHWEIEIAKGQVLLSEGKYSLAEHTFKTSLSSAPTSRHSVDSLNFIGVSLHAQGKDAEAIEHYNSALGKLSSNKSESRRAKLLSNLAQAYSAVGENVQALQCCDEALRIVGNIKISAMEESILLNCYGRLLMKSQEFQKARLVFVQAVRVRESVVGKENAELISPLTNLSGTLLALQELRECEQVCERAIHICRKNIGPQSEELVPLLNNLAHVNLIQSRKEEAQLNLTRSIEVAEKNFGKMNRELILCSLELSDLYEAEGKGELAEKTLERAVDLSRNEFGLQDHRTIDATDALASLYELHGKSSDAERLLILNRASRKKQ